MHKDGSVYDEHTATGTDKKGESGVLYLEKTGKIPGSGNKSTKPPPIPARKLFSDGDKMDSGTGDMSTQQAGSFKHQYYVIKAMKARQCAPAALGGVGGFARGQIEGRPSSDVGFDLEGDCRKFRAQLFHDVANGKNVSISFEFNGFDCLACEPTHSIRGRLDSGEPIAIFLSDQSFPPVLPASDSNCAVVVRVEGGRLFELEKTFKEIFVDYTAPRGRLPAGSVVLVGSLSHLAAFGLDSYATDLVKTLQSMAMAVGRGVDVIPNVSVPLGGVSSAATVRAMFDLDAWILRGPGVALSMARRVFWDVVATG
jgi:hypothetical protein